MTLSMSNFLPPLIVFPFGIVCERFFVPDSGVVGRFLEFYNEENRQRSSGIIVNVMNDIPLMVLLTLEFLPHNYLLTHENIVMI